MARRSSLIKQAKQDARVQFGGEAADLRTRRREASNVRRSTIAGAQGAASGIQAAVAAMLPVVKKQYRDAGVAGGQADQAIHNDLAAIGPTGGSAALITDAESHAARQRLTEALAGAVDELGRRSVGAAQGAAYATTQANAKFGSDLKDIQASRRDLKARQGAFTAAEVTKLGTAADELGIKRGQLAESKRAHQASEANASEANRIREEGVQQRAAAAAAKKRAGTKPLTAGEANKIRTNIETASRWVSRFRANGKNFRTIHSTLLQGVPGGTSVDGKGNVSKVPPIPKFDENTILAAIDLYNHDGHLSQPMYEKLIKRLRVPHSSIQDLAPMGPPTPHALQRRPS